MFWLINKKIDLKLHTQILRPRYDKFLTFHCIFSEVSG